jgi:hypothetical protein
MHKENAFGGVTVLVLATNETESLRQTIIGLEQSLSPENVRNMIIFYPPRATAACKAAANQLAARQFPIPVLSRQQISENNAESLADIIRKEPSATHLMLWASDGEIAPEQAALLVKTAKQRPQAVVKFSRMMKGGSQPAGKSLFLKARDRAFCLLARARLGANITDALFLGHIVFPLAPLASYRLTETGANLGMEMLGLFSRLGWPFIEFPVRAMKRAESKSNIRLKQKFGMLFVILHYRR